MHYFMGLYKYELTKTKKSINNLKKQKKRTKASKSS